MKGKRMTKDISPDQIIEDVTNAILLSQGTEYVGFTGTGIAIRQVKPNSGPLDRLRKNPLAADLIRLVEATLPQKHQ